MVYKFYRVLWISLFGPECKECEFEDEEENCYDNSFEILEKKFWKGNPTLKEKEKLRDHFSDNVRLRRVLAYLELKTLIKNISNLIDGLKNEFEPDISFITSSFKNFKS